MKPYFAGKLAARKYIDFTNVIGRPASYVYIYAVTDSVVRIGSPSYMALVLQADEEIEVKDEEIDSLVVEEGEVEVYAK